MAFPNGLRGRKQRIRDKRYQAAEKRGKALGLTGPRSAAADDLNRQGTELFKEAFSNPR